jgi:hypothetical protein
MGNRAIYVGIKGREAWKSLEIEISSGEFGIVIPLFSYE